jgi:hypothetical protein
MLDLDTESIYRDSALNTLDAVHIPFVVWLDDVEEHYRRNQLASFGGMAVLVHDVDEAAAVLEKYNWKGIRREDVEELKDGNPAGYFERLLQMKPETRESATALCELLGQPVPTAEDWKELEPDGELVADVLPHTNPVILMRDSDWGFDVRQHWAAHPGEDRIYPPLAPYVDALITRIFEVDERVPEDERDFICDPARDALFELYDNYKGTAFPPLREPEFAAQLSPVNRIWHLDAVADVALYGKYRPTGRDKRKQWLDEQKRLADHPSTTVDGSAPQ